MLNKNNAGSGFGIQQCVNLRIRHAKAFNEHVIAMNTSCSKLGGQAQYELFHKTWLREERKCDIFGEWEFYRHFGIFLGNLAGCTSTWRLSDLPEGEYTADLAKFIEIVQRDVDNTTASENKTSLEGILRNCCDMDKLLRLHYKHIISPAHFNVMWAEAMKCCMPTVLSGRVRCFHGYSPAEISRVVVKMEGSKNSGPQIQP